MATCTSYNNTYKFAMARFLLERSRGVSEEGAARMVQEQRDLIVPYAEIAEKFLEYYLPHVYDYGLKQDKHRGYRVLVTYHIREELGDAHPGPYSGIPKHRIRRMVKNIRRDVFGSEKSNKSHVVPKFQKVATPHGARLDKMFYDFDGERRRIMLRPHAVKFLGENYDELRPLPLLRWALYLQEKNAGSGVSRFLEDSGIGAPDGAERELLARLEGLGHADRRHESVGEHCRAARPPGTEGSALLVSTRHRREAEMFESTVAAPVDTSRLGRHRGARWIEGLRQVGAFGLGGEHEAAFRGTARGDVVLFCDEARVHSMSQVLAKARDAGLAGSLWGRADGAPGLVLFLAKAESVDVGDAGLLSMLAAGPVGSVSVERIAGKRRQRLIGEFGNMGNAARSICRAESVRFGVERAVARRRSGQGAFRRRVLENFGGVCAMCGLPDEGLLEAAHIAPVSKRRGMGEVSNGICLCVMHHAMFDLGHFAVRPDYSVFVPDLGASEQSRRLISRGRLSRPRGVMLNPEYLDARLAKLLAMQGGLRRPAAAAAGRAGRPGQ